MLAHKIFFTILLSLVVNNSSIFCMEKKDKNTIKLLPKDLLVAKLPQRFLLVRLPEVEDEIQEKIAAKVVKQCQIDSLAAKEIGLELPRNPIVYASCPNKLESKSATNCCRATITFENSTESVLFINNKKLESKKTVQIEIALLKLTDRLSLFNIPIHAAVAIQPFAGIGPTLYYEKSKKEPIAALKGFRHEIMAEVTDCFFSTQFVTPYAKPQDSEILESENNFYGYVQLQGSETSFNLEAVMGVGNTLYEAVKNMNDEQEKKIKQFAESAANAPAAFVKPQLEQPLKNSCVANKTINKPSSSDSEQKAQQSISNGTPVYATLRSNRSERPAGNVSGSQSTTNVKKEPAFPAAKAVKTTDDPTIKKHGSLIYGSLRKAITRTGSLINVKEHVHKEPK